MAANSAAPAATRTIDCEERLPALPSRSASRVAHGIVTFRSKYGFAPDQNHAMRHCVGLYTGF
jgi:hypothetical protein